MVEKMLLKVVVGLFVLTLMVDAVGFYKEAVQKREPAKVLLGPAIYPVVRPMLERLEPLERRIGKAIHPQRIEKPVQRQRIEMLKGIKFPAQRTIKTQRVQLPQRTAMPRLKRL